MALGLSRRVLLFGICCVLALSFCTTCGVEAQDVNALCKQVAEATAKELRSTGGLSGSTGGFSRALNGGWWYEDFKTELIITIEVFNSIDAAKAQWNRPPETCGPDGQVLSRTSDSFHGYKARWDAANCAWNEDPDTGEVWGYVEFGEIFSWQQDRFIFNIGYTGTEGEAPKSRKKVKEDAEVLFANVQKVGLTQVGSFIWRPVLDKFPDAFGDYYITFIASEAMTGNSFKWDFGDNRHHIPWTEGNLITHSYWWPGEYEVSLTVYSNGDVASGPFKEVITIDRPGTLPPPELAANLEISKGTALVRYFGMGEEIEVDSSDSPIRLNIGDRMRVPDGAPDYYDMSLHFGDEVVIEPEPGWEAAMGRDPTTGKVLVRVDHGKSWISVQKGKLELPTVYTEPGIITITGTELVVDVVDGRITTVKVIKGIVELSDPDGRKTVRVNAGETSTVKLDGLPTDPVPFDPNTIEMRDKRTLPVLSFDFNDGQAQDWIDDQSGRWHIADGVYVMAGNKANSGRDTFYNRILCDFTYQADVRKVAGDSSSTGYGYGLLFRSDGTPENYYEFIIESGGQYQIAKSVNGKFERLVDWPRSNALRTGYNQWNTLKVVAKGDTLQFYANDKLLDTIKDTAHSCGQLGLFAIDASSSTTPDKVEFDNVLIMPES